MRGAQARRHIGFYSEKEFDLTHINQLDGELMELGRSCARKDFRDRALIPLMWEAIAEQVRVHNVRYLFGCGSLYSTDSSEVSAMFSLLKRKFYAADDYRVLPVEKCKFDGLTDDVAIADEQALFQKLPSLIKGYLRIGALVLLRRRAARLLHRRRGRSSASPSPPSPSRSASSSGRSAPTSSSAPDAASSPPTPARRSPSTRSARCARSRTPPTASAPTGRCTTASRRWARSTSRRPGGWTSSCPRSSAAIPR